jgi:phosphoribosylanthranilate isomerase
MTLVKICGVTNLEDALAAVEVGADLLGFNFYRRSPRYVSPEDARRIVERLPESIKGVGVFVNEPADEVERIARAAGLGAVQLHGDETPEFCQALRGLKTIKALRVRAGFDAAACALYTTDALLLDAYTADAFGGTGHTFDWALTRQASECVARLYLAGGLTPDNVAEAVGAVRPYAVDVCSGVETSPGRKSFQLMRRFVEQVREADGRR